MPASLDILLPAAYSLFDWQEPDLPNDLCLVSGQDPWLVTMASCRVAVLVIDDEEAGRLTEELTGLSLAPPGR